MRHNVRGRSIGNRGRRKVAGTYQNIIWTEDEGNYLCTCDLYGPVHSDSDACQYITKNLFMGNINIMKKYFVH